MKNRTDLQKMKQEDQPVAMITAYDYPSAKQAEAAGADMILVGDSLGMVVLGYDSTIPVTMEDMIHHTKAVKRGAPDTFIVTDMPFMSYHSSKAETLKNAARLMQEAGCHAVKLEGAGEVTEMIRALTDSGVPAVAHLGLTPQSVGVLGGYKVQGKSKEAAAKLLQDAIACEKAGAAVLVLECVPRQLAAVIRQELYIPVIGIGAGAETDGQVLVYHDITGYGVSRVPKFVKQYGQADADMGKALSSYVDEVKNRIFPSAEHTFTMNEELLEGLYGGLRK
ncbi:3-methyl-2-oxobutanoate hydroxymethyltransferase [Bacillus mangrovi]|uniref:3-methyl-2-oxobutanoate hydroxymethyltransferase n=1 Tax=Metabacillus mangrovi TaxID=1491830 RepID=A0A7X2V3L1_9BACI|nr:3-methyl-2-oxobutanoate hydroxymethyltransferase [Metabacillus mangrovi]MTH52141.1 3-methyl-2-oxobutanoate hydroxymethyltransferase [Metabacillus mangrovi]